MIAYRYITGKDDSAFCHRVSEALSKGWVLHGDPSYAYDAGAGVMRCAQAVIKENTTRAYEAGMKLSEV